MRTLSLLLLSGALMTACVDRDYDLSDLDFDNVAIGDENSEFRIPLATVQVSMDEIAENGVNIEAIFREADIWLPLRPGTDGALALGWFNWIIENEAYDLSLIHI